MKKHESNVKLLVETISEIVNNDEQWNTSILGNNKLLDMVEELKNQICLSYVETIEQQ